MNNVVVWSGRERHVGTEAMKRVVLEYADALRAGAAVNIWHLSQDMERARADAVRALKESEAKVG